MFVWDGTEWKIINLIPEYIDGNNLDGGGAVPDPNAIVLDGGQLSNGTDGIVIDGGAALINN